MVFSVWLKRLIHHILSELEPQHGSSENPARRYIYNIVLVCFILLLAYVTARSFTPSFTHDESLSFTVVQGKTNWARSATNHFLNTVLMKICSVV